MKYDESGGQIPCNLPTPEEEMKWRIGEMSIHEKRRAWIEENLGRIAQGMMAGYIWDRDHLADEALMLTTRLANALFPEEP